MVDPVTIEVGFAVGGVVFSAGVLVEKFRSDRSQTKENAEKIEKVRERVDEIAERQRERYRRG